MRLLQKEATLRLAGATTIEGRELWSREADQTTKTAGAVLVYASLNQTFILCMYLWV